MLAGLFRNGFCSMLCVFVSASAQLSQACVSNHILTTAVCAQHGCFPRVRRVRRGNTRITTSQQRPPNKWSSDVVPHGVFSPKGPRRSVSRGLCVWQRSHTSSWSTRKTQRMGVKRKRRDSATSPMATVTSVSCQDHQRYFTFH